MVVHKALFPPVVACRIGPLRQQRASAMNLGLGVFGVRLQMNRLLGFMYGVHCAQPLAKVASPPHMSRAPQTWSSPSLFFLVRGPSGWFLARRATPGPGQKFRDPRLGLGNLAQAACPRVVKMCVYPLGDGGPRTTRLWKVLTILSQARPSPRRLSGDFWARASPHGAPARARTSMLGDE